MELLPSPSTVLNQSRATLIRECNLPGSVGSVWPNMVAITESKHSSLDKDNMVAITESTHSSEDKDMPHTRPLFESKSSVIRSCDNEMPLYQVVLLNQNLAHLPPHVI